MAVPPAPGMRVVAEAFTSNAAAFGYRFNHTMLRVKEITRSVEFYRDLLGMSLLFTLNTGPFTTYYLGYPPPGAKVPADVAMNMSGHAGLLELVHVNGSPEVEYEMEQSKVSFGHLGFCVPDVRDTLQRAQVAGWHVAKWPEDISVKTMALPESIPEGSFHENLVRMYKQVGFLTDPDGNWIEILPISWER